LSPTTNNLNGGYHFVFHPYGAVCNIDFWTNGEVASDHYSFIPPGIPSSPWPGQKFVIECFISGTTATFDYAGWWFQVSDARFASFGGQFFSPEIYDGGFNANPPFTHFKTYALWAMNNADNVATNMVSIAQNLSNPSNTFTGNGSGLTYPTNSWAGYLSLVSVDTNRPTSFPVWITNGWPGIGGGMMVVSNAAGGYFYMRPTNGAWTNSP
jgi:hypothetical protein